MDSPFWETFARLSPPQREPTPEEIEFNMEEDARQEAALSHHVVVEPVPLRPKDWLSPIAQHMEYELENWENEGGQWPS